MAEGSTTTPPSSNPSIHSADTDDNLVQAVEQPPEEDVPAETEETSTTASPLKGTYNPANNDSFEDIPSVVLVGNVDPNIVALNVVESASTSGARSKKISKDSDPNAIALSNMIDTLAEREKAVTRNGEAVMSEIRQQAQRLVDIITATERAQVDLVSNTMQHKLYFLTQQKDEAEKALERITEKQQTSQKFNPKIYTPGEEANIKFSINTPLLQKVEEELGALTTGYAFIPHDPPGSKPGVVGEAANTGIIFKTKEGFPLNIPADSLSCVLKSPTGKEVPCGIQLTNEKGKYSFTYLPKERGRHSLTIKIHDVSICSDIAMTLAVVPSVSMRDKPLKVIDGLSNPWGISVNKGGQIFITEQNRNRADFVTVFDKNFKEIRTFPQRGTKETKFCKPRGIALTNDRHFIVTDEHRLSKITLEGRLVSCIKGEESFETSFQFPRGIALHPTTGQIYVADHANHWIQVINPDFTHSHNIGTKKGAGHLKLPQDIAFDREGKHAFVTNTEKNCIDVFTTDGTHTLRFGKRGLGKGELIRPIGITVDEFNHVYVTEDKRVSVFKTNGTFVRHIGYDNKGNRIFKEPCGITIDRVGQLYIVDAGRNEVLIF